MRRLIQSCTACLLVLASLTVTPLAQPDNALALDATITTCDWDSFSATLDAVQTDGGGTITFDCSDAIVFEHQQTITSDVTIIGNGDVRFDGGESTRLFQVNNDARLALADLTVQNGYVDDDGGAIINHGTLEISSSTFSGNRTDDGDAGAILSDGVLTIIDSTFTDNHAAAAGAIGNFGTLTITASIFSGNEAEGAGAIGTIGGVVTITASTFTDNRALNGFGGALANNGRVKITASAFSNNRASHGGAFYNFAGPATVTASTFSANSAGGFGGAILTFGNLEITASEFSGNSAGITGGAINNNGGSLTVRTSTFSDNSASSTTTGGGAIRNNEGTLTVTASSFNGNYADASGGAIQNFNGMLTVKSSTFSDNYANTGGEAIDNFGGTVTIATSILVNISSDDSNCSNFGTLTLVGSNLSDDGSCGIAIGDANLAPLADNGGPTLTMLPQAPSDALDAAACTDTSPVDQRGATRPVGGCDIGSVEVGATVPVQIIAFVSLSGTVEAGDSVDLLAIAYGPDNTNLIYGFDCDNNGSFETPGADTGTSATGSCGVPAGGVQNIAVQVCDGGDPGNCATTPERVLAINPPVIVPSPSAEGQSVVARATFNTSYSVTCTVDYGDGFGQQAGIVAGNICRGLEHTYLDDRPGGYTVTVEVCNAVTCVSDSTTHNVTNVAPSVAVPEVTPSPSDEGGAVTARATFADPGILDTHTCTVDYGDGSGTQDGTIENGACTGPEHTYVDGDNTFTVTIEVCDDSNDCGQTATIHTVTNVAPTIDSITTNGPVAQGQPVTVTVEASDPGINDVLSYRFDCDDDGSYEVGPQASSTTDCPLDPAQATTTITVEVSDGDGGLTTGSVEVGQTLTLCGNYSTGSLSTPGVNGCPNGSMPLVLPSATSTTFCLNPYSGAMTWSPSGSCGPNVSTHLVPDDGPLTYCRHQWTGKLRHTWNGQCGTYETPGVIPGTML